MPRYCCVPGCKNRKGGHLFPTSNPELNKWRVAVRRCDPKSKNLWKPDLDKDIVCADHFLPSDYVCNRRKKVLKVGSVPSVFKHQKNPVVKPRETGVKRRVGLGLTESQAVIATSSTVTSSSVEVLDVFGEEHIIETPLYPAGSSTAGPIIDGGKVEVGIQCDRNHANTFHFTVSRFKNDFKSILYYTGFEDYRQFHLFLDIMMYDMHDLEYRCTLLSYEDQLFLTLIKLRQAFDHLHLAHMFNVSETTVSRVFSAWINHIYNQLRKIPIWPSKNVVLDTMPDYFAKEYPSTRVIIDTTEIAIEKPSDVLTQRQTFSYYKNRNTLKLLIGITPKGLVSYIGECYGGAASDRAIIEQSDLLVKADMLFERGDSIMADKGFVVQDLFAPFDVKINIPTVMKGMTRLSQPQRLDDFTVSSKRVHVERVIGYAKTFKLIHKVLPYNLLPLSNKIVYICFALLNFRKPIVN